MRIKAHLSRALVASLFIFSTGAPLLALANRAPTSLSESDIKTIDRLTTELYDSQDSRKASAAADTLGSYPYQEVVDALIARTKGLLQDHSAHKTYSFTVKNSLVALAKIATSDDAAKIADLRSTFEQNRYNPVVAPIQSYLDTDFDTLESNSRVRTSPNPTYMPKAVAGAAKTVGEMLNELVQAGKLDKETAMSIMGGLVASAEENLFDRAVKYSNEKSFPKFHGRETELEQIAQGLLRLEKGHVIMTGKAGVGKTTILKMLQNGWFQGTITHRGTQPPIILELSITDITNPSDPSAIKSRVGMANELARVLDRHVVLFVDEAHISTEMTRNALKNFLTKEISADQRVHFIWATTSAESRTFRSDSAFGRRWVEVDVPEFTREQSIEAVKSYQVPRWRQKHVFGQIAFTDISVDAYEFAAKYAHYEQPHAGNPTGIKELLEGAILHRAMALSKLAASGTALSEDQKKFTLEVADIRKYMTERLRLKLMPGDPDFEVKFEKIWSDLTNEYAGNQGLKHKMREKLFSHFGTLVREQTLALALEGPPGAGKSYLPKLIARHFFSNQPLIINLAEYGSGDLSLNKLIGSPTGTVGSEQQRSILTKFIMENRSGGVIVFEEADFGGKDIFNFLVNALSDKKFTDGLGQEFNIENFIFIFNTNVGQDRMINRATQNAAITWEDVEMRRRAITQDIVVDGKHVNIVRPDVEASAFGEFIAKIAKNVRESHVDTTTAAQDGEKLKRRITPFYVLPPSQDDLREAARKSVADWIKSTKLEFGVDVVIPESAIETILDVKGFRFEEGYGYVNRQLIDRLFSKLTPYISHRGQKIDVSMSTEQVPYGRKMLTGNVLNISTGTIHKTISLGISVPQSQNPWYTSEDISKRIEAFPEAMSKLVMGQDQQIAETYEALRRKRLNWNSRIVITQIGTSGNGKTEFGYSLAEVLFGTRDAAKKISGIQNWGDLNNYFRSDTGFVGSHEETDFERWFMSRKTLGGGVIILDELLSFDGLNQSEIGAKIAAINKLYDMLDEGFIRFGNRNEDARGFIIEVTGNAMQELFNGIDDSPESERLVKRVLQKTSKTDIANYFLRKYGFDAPKLARLGTIYINGPLGREATDRVGAKEALRAINQATNELRQLYDIEVQIDKTIVSEITKRVTTVKLGMRDVNKAIGVLLVEPVTGILTDLEGTEKIEADLVDGKIVWKADGHEVVKVVTPLGEASIARWTEKARVSDPLKIKTPQLRDIEQAPKIVLSEREVQITAIHEVYGHWMVDFLLTGENKAETISLIPTEEALGFVRSKESPEYEASTLVTWFKRVAMLESGSRAVFISGIYASGGGTGGEARDPNKQRADDLGKVDRILDAMLSNQIFRDVTEFSDNKSKTLFKEFMRHVGKNMADRLIRYGLNSKQFEPIFQEAMKERFLNDVRLEEMIQHVDRSKIMSPSQATAWAISNAVVQTMEHMKKQGRSPEELAKLSRLANELVQKSSIEIHTRSRADAKTPEPAWLSRMRRGAQSKIGQIVGKQEATPTTGVRMRGSRCEIMFNP